MCNKSPVHVQSNSLDKLVHIDKMEYYYTMKIELIHTTKPEKGPEATNPYRLQVKTGF